MDSLLIVFLLLAMATAAWLLLRPTLPGLYSWIGNWRVHFALRRSLPASHYSVFRDFTLRPQRSGPAPATRIDHVVVSPYGIFVIAIEPGSGCIFGAEGDARWTCAHFRAVRELPNPLHRNQAHIRALRELLGLEESCFHSLVVFTGNTQFEAALPANVTQLGGLLPFIQVRTAELLGFEEAERVAGLIESSRPPPGVPSAAEQLAVLKETHGSRLSAKQAVLGLGLMAALLLAAGGLAHRLAELPAQYPSRDGAHASSPFLKDADAPPPRIDLPGTTGRQPSGQSTRPFGEEAQPPARAGVEQASIVAAGRVRAGQAAMDERLAWESRLKCAYAAETRRCACYEPQGRKAIMDFDSCRALADQGAGTPRD